MDTLWYFLQESGPETIVMVVVACVFVLALAAIALVSLLMPLDRGAVAAHRWAASLAVSGTLLVGLLMVLGAVAGHDRVFESVTADSAAYKAMSLARGLAHSMHAWYAGGCALIGLALFGSAAVWLTGARLANKGEPVPAAIPAVVGLCVAGGLLGVGVLLRAMDSITGFSAMAMVSAESKAALWTQFVRELPSVAPWALAGLAALTGGAVAAALSQKGRPGMPSSRALIVASVSVLGLGALAFGATRDRAADCGTSLEEALALAGDDGARLEPQPGLDLPEAKNTTDLAWAPVLLANAEELRLDYELIARFPSTEASTSPPMPDLEALAKPREQSRLLDPKKPLELITLQADQSLARQHFAWILSACHGAGYRSVQLAVPERRRIDSAVLGSLAVIRHRALVIDLTDGTDAKALPEGKTLGEIVKQLDGWASKGRVAIRLPAPAPEPEPQAP